MPQPGIDRLLVRSALEADLCRQLRESPDEVFQEFDLTEEEKDLLRQPDHRLLPVLGSVLAHQAVARAFVPAASRVVSTLFACPLSPGSTTEACQAGADPAGTKTPDAGMSGHPNYVETSLDAAGTSARATSGAARTLPDMALALTVVPCARVENGESKYSYAVWVNPLPEGADPANLAPPAGATLPGQPLAPLHIVIQLSAVEVRDASGQPQVGLSASLRQSSNIIGPPSPQNAGRAVDAAVAAVRSASKEERYGRLIDLMRALHSGGVR